MQFNESNIAVLTLTLSVNGPLHYALLYLDDPYLHQGLVETVHPYTFVARQGFKELLDTEQSADKVIPLLSKTTPHIRAALVSFIQHGSHFSGLT